MTMSFCIGLGSLLTLLGLVGSVTGGHPHVMLGFGTNFLHNVLRLSLGFLALAAVAAGPRHTRMFCLALAPLFAALALAGYERLPTMMELLNPRAVDVWLYGMAAVCSSCFGVASPAPLRLRTAVERAPVTWA